MYFSLLTAKRTAQHDSTVAPCLVCCCVAQEYLAEQERQRLHEHRKDRMLVQQLSGYGSTLARPGVRGGARGKLARKSTPVLSSATGLTTSGDEENEQDDYGQGSPSLAEVCWHCVRMF